jgi:hypothetical protein
MAEWLKYDKQDQQEPGLGLEESTPLVVSELCPWTKFKVQ